jgi:glycerol uptake operon antiterminator
MSIINQKILPAIKHMKEFENLMDSPYEFIVLLDSHIAQLKGIVHFAKQYNKKILIHADLVHGLASDEYGAEFLCQEIKPAGILSTRTGVILTAKKKGLIAIQRLFLLDSHALEKHYSILEKNKPDYIEVLPGVMPHIIKEVYQKTNIPIFAGGFIRTIEDVENAIAAGAKAITTTRKEIWEHFTK